MIINSLWQISNGHCGHGIADAIFGVPSKVISKQRLIALHCQDIWRAAEKKECVIYIVYISKFFGGGGNAHSPNHSSHWRWKKCKIQKQFVNFKTTQIYSIPHIILELRSNTFFGFCSFKTYQTIRDLVKMEAICVINAGRSLWDKNVFVINFE